MANNKNKFDRRAFIKTAGTAGLASVFAGTTFAQSKKAKDPEENLASTQQASTNPQVPKRKLGKTGAEISILGLGGMFDIPNNKIVLRKAVDWGVTFWDTAHNYENGHSELGIGQFIKKNPGTRKKLFIVSKASRARTPQQIEEKLQLSLKRMNTDYIDLYYGIHAMDDPSRLTDELRRWAEDAKKRKVIRYFGFSTHSNMAGCLTTAARLGWIDVIMPSYNFRLMQDPQLQAAVDACHKAGIGLIAMKVLAKGATAKWTGQSAKLKTEKDKKLVDHFLQRGFTEGQAKIKAVLEDERFSSACVTMQNIALLTSNVAAVLDKTKLTQADADVFREYAEATCSGYCAGCADICQAALPEAPYISDIMRYLMYYNSYGDRDRAKELFARIPCEVRNKLAGIDYRKAEKLCPQNLPIAKFINEALKKLA